MPVKNMRLRSGRCTSLLSTMFTVYSPPSLQEPPQGPEKTSNGGSVSLSYGSVSQEPLENRERFRMSKTAKEPLEMTFSDLRHESLATGWKSLEFSN